MTAILIIAMLAMAALGAWVYFRRLAATDFKGDNSPPAVLPVRDAAWHLTRFDRALEQTTATKARKLELQRWRDYYAGLAELSKPE